MAEQADVQVKLTLDDAASKVADGIRGKFRQLKASAKGVGQEFLNVGKNALSTALGMQLAPSLQGIVDSFREMVNNATEVQGHMRAVASYFVMGGNEAWDSAMKRSAAIDAQLYKASIAIGQNIEDARRAFQNLAKASDGTTESLNAAVAQTEKLLMFADVTGENVSMIADEWAMMEKGMVRTRGTLFKMMFSTGMFGKDLTKASSTWAKLTDSQRSKAMATAMNSIVDKFSKAPQTMASVLAGFDNIKKRIMDVVGANVIEVLTAKFDNLLKAIEGKRPRLEAIAARFGKYLGEQIQYALDWAGEGLTYLEQNWDDIQRGIKEGAKTVYKVAKFIYDNKNVILAAWGVNAMAPGLQLALQTAPYLAALGSRINLLASTSIPSLITATRAQTAAAWQANKGLLAMAAAAAAVYAALDQYEKLQKEGGFEQAWQTFKYGENAYTAADISAVEKAMKDAIAAGNMESAAQIRSQAIERLESRKVGAQAKYGAQAPEEYAGMGITAMENLLAKFSKDLPTAEDIAFANSVETQSQLIESYNQAVAKGDQVMATYIANLAGKSEAMAYGLNDSSLEISGGFDAFMARLGEKTKAVVEQLNKAYAEAHPGKVPKAAEAVKPASINMHGGQTFNIKQDFKEADPDRIALYFRRDLTRAVTSRTRARVRTPFGI